MRFRHKMTGKNTIKRVFSFLLMLCLLVPMLPSSIGLEAKADDTTNTATGDDDTVKITLHDLYIDRKEALPDGTDLVKATGEKQDKACLLAYKYARSVTVKKGTTLEQAFEQFKNDENLQLGTPNLAETKVYKPGTEDKTAMTSEINASECIWYTRGVDEESHSGGIDGNNPREKFDSTKAINNNIDLYTYSYRLRLVKGEKKYSDLIVREGQTEGFIAGNRDDKKSISDFLASVDNNWIDINTDTAADTSALTGGLTRNYILRQSKEFQNTTTLTYYAAVDGKWKVVKTDTDFDLDRVDVWGRTGPALNYYVTDTELKNIYGKYGFGTDVNFANGEITKEKNGYFPYSNGTGTNLYIRQMPKYETVNNTTQFRVPLIEDTPSTQINEGGLAIYYTPHNTMEYDSRFLDGTKDRNGWASPTDSAVLKENSFYTVSVDDADKDKFNTDALPNKDTYYLYGSDATVTLPLKDKDGKAVKWYVEKGGDNVTIKENGDAATVTVKAIDKQLILTTDASKEYADDVQVHCFVLVNGEPKEIGKLHTHAKQQYDDWGNTKYPENKTRYYVTAEQAEAVFEEFGFKSSEFDPTQDEQKYIFANTTYDNTKNKSGDKIWTDAVPAKFNDVYKIPLAKSTEFNGVSGSKDLSLYYVPKNTTNGGIAVTDTALKTSNFYSITFEDPENKLQSDSFPKTKYVLSGNDAKVTIPAKDGVEWYIKDASAEKENYVILMSNGTTSTVSVSSINHAVVLTTKSAEKSSNHISVHCYALVDKQEVEAGTVYFSTSQNAKLDSWQNNRYFISTQILEKVYTDYNFKASEYKGELYFPVTVHDANINRNDRKKIWADTSAVKYDGSEYYKIPLTSTDGQSGTNEQEGKKNVDLFYAPKGITGASADRTDDVFLTSNSLFSITAKDEANKFPSETLPKAQYVWSGEKATVTLPYSKDVTWTAWYCSVDADGKLTPFEKALLDIEEEVSQDKKTVTFTFPKVSDTILITTSDQYTEDSKNFITLTAYISLNGTWTKVDTKLSGIRKTHVSISSGKYYITSEELEYIYGKYGFKSTDWDIDKNAGQKLPLFGCEVGTTKLTNIWADNEPVKQGNSWYLPLVATSYNSVQIFYLPNNTPSDENFKGDSRLTIAAKANAIYEINILDEANQFDGYTDTQYAAVGKDKTITLPYKEGVSWYRDQNPDALEATDPDTDSGTAKYTISDVVQATTVTTKKPIVKNYVNVSAYISKDGKWTEISTTTIPDRQIKASSDGNRYYITSKQLEDLFGAYGFQAKDYKDTAAEDLSKHFPNGSIQSSGGQTDGINNDDLIWTNAGGTQNNDGTWSVNTILTQHKEKGIAIYYVPKTDGITGNYFKKDDATVLHNNQFYTITVKDGGKKFDSNTKLPETIYALAGDTTISLPYVDGVKWTLLSGKTNDDSLSAINSTQKVSEDKQTAQISFYANSDLTATTEENVENRIKLEAYVSLDDVWTRIEETSISKANWNGSRFYITEKELQDIYQPYGFTSLSKDIYSFGITTLYNYNKQGERSNNDFSIWPDQFAKSSEDGMYLPLIEDSFVSGDRIKENIVQIYYLPRNEKSDTKNKYTDINNETYKKGVPVKASTNYTDAQAAMVAQDNTFYTVTCKDPSGQLGNTKLPDTQYILRGESRTIEVPYVEGVTWYVTDKNGVPLSMKLTRNGDKMTLGITNADQALVITTKSETDKLPENAIALNAYVAIDDEWVPVYDTWTNDAGTFVGGTLTISKSQLTKIGDTNKYFITVKQLENIYGQYGFSAEEFDNVNHFPHNTITSSTNDQVFKYIYADGEVIGTGSSARIPLIEEKNTSYGIAIYYTPKYTPINEPEDKKDNKWEKTDKDCLKTNSVKYTVSVDDPNSLLSAEQKLPEAKLYDRETKVSINLPSLGEGKEWIAVDANTYVSLKKDAYEVTPNSDGTVNATINSLTQKVTWIPVETPNTMVKYDVGLAQTDWQDLGKIFPADEREQTVTQDGMIRGKAATYLDYAKTGNTAYNVLQPDYDYVKVRVSIVENGRDEPRDFYYTFKGWHIVKNGETLDNNLSVDIQPGQERTLDLNQYSNASTVVLKAVWKAKVGGNGDNATQNRPNTVNFYLSTDCEIMDNMSNGFQGQAKGNFTRTIYSTRIYGTGRLQETGATRGDFQVLAPADNASTAYSTDRSLRDSVTRPIVAQDITDNIGLTLESFPSDEEILDELKNRVAEKEVTITLEGESIQPDELTTENFAVRWYVLKYHGSDAWHIDGVLVAKEGHAVVTKTFIGDKEAIAEIKQNYFISVTHQHIGEEDVHDDYTLTLTSADQETGSGKQGYTHYDEGTDTYIWVLTGRQGRTYTVTENNYLANSISKADTFDGTYQYMIENSSDEDVNTNGWKSYTRGVQLKAEAYANDAPEDSYQTLSFQNIYVQKGLLSVAKIDAATGRGLANVNFTIKREDGKAIQVLQENDTRATTHKYEVQAAGTTYDASKYTKVDQLTTDANGYFYISLPIDKDTSLSTTYVLTETLPVGYDGPTELEVTVSDNGQIQHITQVTKPNKPLENNKPWVSGENTAILTINNYSKILLTVTAQKQWDESVPADERKPVRVELWRNGVKMTDTANQLYTQTLDESNSWTYTWNDLPLYVDGEPAQYSLHEVQIGDVKYDLTAGSNGYKDYVVSYDPIKYLDTLGDAETPLTADWTKAHNTAYWDDGSKRVYAQHALLVVTNSKKPADIFFKKTDGLGNPLEGALFGMYADADCKQLLSQSKSDANGQVQFVSRTGDMYIKEISAPDGCTLDPTVYKVISDASGKKILQKVSDSSSVETIANLSHINLLIQKVDNNDQALKGAEFKIEKLNAATKEYQSFGQGTYKVDSEDGIVRIVDNDNNLLNFDEGKYRITETKTPGSAYRNAGSIIVTVQGGQVYYEKSNADTDIDSWTMERRANTVIYTLQVVNSPWYALPSTGNFNPSAALAALLGAALMCGASALALWLRKKRRQNML